jgi:hemoglobin
VEHRTPRSLIRRGAWVAALALAGCAAPASAPPGAPTPSLYERVGGREAIAAVVDDAIVNFAADERINRRFGNASIPKLRHNLVDLLCLRTGGPCRYDGASMSDAHEGMQIRAEEFDAMIDDIARSLDKFRVPARERGEVLAILRQMKSAVIEH